MQEKLAILRGINVGGKRKILMADLKSLCEKLEWEEVRSYIQSGNIIFKSNKENLQLEEELSSQILDHYGFEVPVIVRSKEELYNAINKNPFYNEAADVNSLHLTFLKEKPEADDLSQIKSLSFEPDEFAIDDQYVFIYYL